MTPDLPPSRPRVRPLLRASFTRTGSRRDEVEVVLADGATRDWSWPTTGLTLPHDLAHVAVESAFELAHGFWGLVAQGIDLAGGADHAAPATGPRPGRAAFAHLGQAEAAVGVLAPRCPVPIISDDTAVAMLLVAFARSNTPPNTTAIDVIAVQRARRMLSDLTGRWRAVSVGEQLTVTFPLADDAARSPLARDAPRRELQPEHRENR